MQTEELVEDTAKALVEEHGPHLVIAAWWQEGVDLERAVEAIRALGTLEGFPRGTVVTFHPKTASLASFRRDLYRLNLDDALPGGTSAPPPRTAQPDSAVGTAASEDKRP